MPENDVNRPHILVSNSSTKEPFTSPGSGSSRQPVIPDRNRNQHSQRLITQLAEIGHQATATYEEQEALGLERGLGIQIQFESAENADFPYESLARDSRGIELLNVKNIENRSSATVFVPEGKLQHFENLITKYQTEESASGKWKNLKLISSIEQIRQAAFDGLWTDDPAVLPQVNTDVIEWEIWLPVRKNRIEVIEQFLANVEILGLQASEKYLVFPERTVIAVRGTTAQIVQSARLLDSIAEIRRVKETADFFVEMNNHDQRAFADDLIDRTQFPTQEVPFVSVLDTGINNGHPLLAPLLSDIDKQTVEPAWGTDDIHGHGTGMAGLAAYGDLTPLLESEKVVILTHRLESAKILRTDGDNAKKHHGNLTVEAISRLEVTAPDRSRVICMAVTSKDYRDRGRPSAWSATIDNLCSGAFDDSYRLIMVSAGNVQRDDWLDYPEGNITDGIHDPGQSWNAITIGAFTDKNTIQTDAPGYVPIANAGDISPHSTTSRSWVANWPLKPEIVFEGGNIARDEHSAVTMGSLDLTSTFHRPQERLFDYFNATSAATALASNLAAKLMAEYPHLWPETIRALLIHSARWTEVMKASHLPANPNTADYENLIRMCGYGTPNMERALWSANNALTLIAQDELQPFWKVSSSYKTKDMSLHSLPWPREALSALGETQVTMRVTLSYFVEASPSARGTASRYRYPSHGLRFDMRRADETEEGFKERINRAARDEESGTAFGGDGGGWILGKQKRHRGSIHSDYWVGTAADLAARNQVAVYPTIGWWRERHHLERFSKSARYSLLIGIETPDVQTDLYSEVELQLPVPVQIEV